MLEVWGRKNSFNVQKVLWCCEELEISYRRHDAGGLFGGTNEDEYLARNPTGLVPTIIDGDFTLWESNTIVRYLSASYGAGSLWPEDPAERALADKWMDFQLGTFFPAFKDVLLGLVRTPAERRDPAKIEASASKTGEVLTVLDAHLRDNEYVAGPSLTMGDIALGSSVYRWLLLDIERPDVPALEAWHERLEGRPAFQSTVMVSFAMEDPPRPED
ncbi:glutathione S-transferase [soil metagenome]